MAKETIFLHLCRRAYKNSLISRGWNVYFTPDSQEPAKEPAVIIQLERAKVAGGREGGGGLNPVGSDCAASHASPLVEHVETLNWETVTKMLVKKIIVWKGSWKGKASKITFFPLQIMIDFLKARFLFLPVTGCQLVLTAEIFISQNSA